MNTPSHFLINAALRRGTRSRHALPRTPFLIGAILPDVPLAVLSLGTYLRARLDGGLDTGAVMRDAFDERFFREPLWIAAHNLFHAPLLLAVALVLLWRHRHRPASRLRWAFWLFAGCAVHTLIDLATHYDDGPVIFFPFEWTIRLHSPVSYWDRRHFGSQFFVFELCLDAALLVYLAWPSIRHRLTRHSVDQPYGGDREQRAAYCYHQRGNSWARTGARARLCRTRHPTGTARSSATQGARRAVLHG